jgi:hypothetical protein
VAIKVLASFLVDLAVAEADGRVGVLFDDDAALLCLHSCSFSCHNDQHRVGLFFDIIHDFPKIIFNKIVQVLLLLCLLLEFLCHDEDFIVELMIFLRASLNLSI